MIYQKVEYYLMYSPSEDIPVNSESLSCKEAGLLHPGVEPFFMIMSSHYLVQQLTASSQMTDSVASHTCSASLDDMRKEADL